MATNELLEEVKSSLGITGSFHDKLLKNYINEVLEFLSDAGVPDGVLQSEAIIGTVARGVSDLWNYGQPGGDLSPYFMKRVIQLLYKKAEPETTE